MLLLNILFVIIHRITPRNVTQKSISLWISVLLHSGLQLFSTLSYSEKKHAVKLEVAESHIRSSVIYILLCVDRKGCIGGSCMFPTDWKEQSQGHSAFVNVTPGTDPGISLGGWVKQLLPLDTRKEKQGTTSHLSARFSTLYCSAIIITE